MESTKARTPETEKPAAAKSDGPSDESAESPPQTDADDLTGEWFDKFCWLQTVYANKTFTDSEKAVLAYVAVFSVINGGRTFCVRQDTLAEHCGTSESTVSRAIRRGKKLGYLAVSRQRKTGYGRHGADELRLESPVKSTAESGKSAVKLTADSAESPVKSQRVTRQIDGCNKEYRSLHSSLKEGGAAPATKPTPESHRTPPICRKHPDGPDHDEPCRSCMRWRRWIEDEQARTSELQRQEVLAMNAVRDACNMCDEAGWLLGDDGGATAARCTHRGDGRRTA